MFTLKSKHRILLILNLFKQETKASESVKVVANNLNEEESNKDTNKTSFSMGMIHLIMHSLDPLTEGL